MYVEIQHTWDSTPMKLTAQLNYYLTMEAEEPAHVDTLVFELDGLIGPVPPINLSDLAKLRNHLYERLTRIEASIKRLQELNYVLDQLPPGTRFTQGAVLRMLEGALDG